MRIALERLYGQLLQLTNSFYIDYYTKLKLHRLLLLITIVSIVFTTLYNDFFILTAVIGLLAVIYSIQKYRIRFLIINLVIIAFIIMYAYVIEQDAAKNLIFFHVISGVTSLAIFSMLSRETYVADKVAFNAVLLLSLPMSVLQFWQLIPSMHWPRISGIFTSPNQFAAFCFLYMYVIRERKLTILLVSLLTQSSSLIPPIMLCFTSLVSRRQLTKFITFTFISFCVYLFYLYGPIYFEKYSSFFVSLVNSSDPRLLELMPVTVATRIKYLVDTFHEIFILDLYFQFRPFEFREGFLLTVTSINPLIAIILSGYIISFSLKLIKDRSYALILVVLIWAFVLPVFEPIFLLLLLRNAD